LIPTYRPYLSQEEIEAVADVFNSRWLGMGKLTEKFEEKLSEFLGVKHVIAVSSGTAALHLALDAFSLFGNDEVITPSLTFAATVQAIRMAGAKPVFCEVSADTLNIDIKDLAKRITKNTKVILPVHYGGSACQIDEIIKLVRGRGIKVVEDAAHAFGSEYKGKMIGAWGDITCFSFDPIKNITCGDGGAVATDDDGIAEVVGKKRYLGIDRNSWNRLKSENNWYYEVETDGFRYHMNDIHAAIGLVQLDRFSKFKKRKQEIVHRYDCAFRKITGLRLIKRNNKETFPFGYFIRVLDECRDSLISYLKSNGISTRVQFIPNHIQRAFANYHQPLPVTEQLYREIVTLPLYYEMSDTEVEKVISVVCAFFDKVKSVQAGEA
jgi:perosamine synthetase